MVSRAEVDAKFRGHRVWVRLTHWLISSAVIVLMFSGLTILMAHPRFYWDDAGNDLTPALFEVPLGPNYRNLDYSPPTPFLESSTSPVTANLLSHPWNQNAWARSLHFLAAWGFLAGLVTYLAFACVSGHARRVLWPRRDELRRDNLWQDIRAHLHLPMPPAEPGPPYAILQKLAYTLVVFVALPVMVLTGITMSPAITASYPFLVTIFAGAQSARTIHFFTFALLAIFLLVHLAMILLTGPVRQLRGMIWGN